MIRWRTTFLVVVVLLLAACSTPGDAASPEDGIGFVTGDGSVMVVPVEERVPAPELVGTTLDSKRLSTADYSGQIIVLNVWGSWCAPCRAEAPELVEAAEEMPEVQLIGVNTRDLDPAPAQAFERAFELPYPSFYDPDGALLLGFGQVPPNAIPSTIVLDESGRVAARMLGEITATTLVGVVEDVRAAQ